MLPFFVRPFLATTNLFLFAQKTHALSLHLGTRLLTLLRNSGALVLGTTRTLDLNRFTGRALLRGQSTRGAIAALCLLVRH